MASLFRQPDPKEITGQYSSAVFFLFAVFMTLYGSIAFVSFDKFMHDHGEAEELGLALASVSISFRAIGTVLVWLVWFTKPGLQGTAPSSWHHGFQVFKQHTRLQLQRHLHFG